MKVLCRCCHRPFDYDMYMGLCPKCGRVYRRGREGYSAIERDMVGDFHIHVDDGGLNRGIDGVVYNQSSSENVSASFDDYVMSTSGYKASKPVNAPYSAPKQTNIPVTAMRSPSASIAQRQAAYTAVKKEANGYFAPDHKTKMNQPVVNNKKSSDVGAIIFIIILIIAIISSIMN